MPYPNEHSARIKRPKKDARYWRRNLDDGLGVILMDGNVQSIRFNVGYWTSKDAKKYLRDAGWKVLKFEEAQES